PAAGVSRHTWPRLAVVPSGARSSTCSTLNPLVVSWLTAASALRPTTSGTEAAVVGAIAISRITCDPRGADEPPLGAWFTTVPGASSSDSTSTAFTANPAASRWPRASSSGRPPTDGTGTASPKIVVGTVVVVTRGGSGNPTGSSSAVAACITPLQICAGSVPPYTAIGVFGGVIGRFSAGKPTHTAVVRCGV